MTELLNKIFLADCRETMKRFPDKSIDLVVTSPPYNMNLRIRNGSYCSRQIVKEFSTKYTGFSDNLPIDDFYALHREILSELLRVSKMVFYNIQIVTGSKRAFFKLIGDFSDSLKDIVIWDKGHAQPAMQKQVLNRRSELLLIFDPINGISRKFTSSCFDRGTLDDIWKIPRGCKVSTKHSAVFPEQLVEKILVNFSTTGSVIYDPYAGTGTTLAVAKRLGYRYIGSENNLVAFNIAKQRLCQ